MRAVALLGIVLLAGCLEGAEAPESSGNATSPSPHTTIVPPDEPDARPFAFRVALPCVDCGPNATSDPGSALLFLEDGDLLRAVLVEANETTRAMRAGPTWAPVVLALNTSGRRDLAPIDAQRVALPDAQVEALRAALEGWAPPVDFADAPPCGRPCPSVLGRLGDERWEMIRVARSPILGTPDNAAYWRIEAAMTAPPTASTPTPTSKPVPPAASTPAHPPTSPPPPGDAGPIDWQGMDNEFGSIRTPYSVQVWNDTRAAVQARIVLREHYEAQDGRFYLFRWSVEGTPMDLSFDSLVRGDTRAELPCYQREGSPTTFIGCAVELAEMPPPGTEIVMTGTVGASRDGSYELDVWVIPFNATWTHVKMSNGLDAELYTGTQVLVEGVPPPASMP